MSNSQEIQSRKNKFGRTRVVLLGIGIAAIALFVWFSTQKPANSQISLSAKTQAISVHTALVSRADMPQYLEGLGTVQASNTVMVTPRVDGQLQEVAFTEGQTVKQGDILAKIDPRPYRAALDLSIATKSKDEAQLANAKRDLERYQALAPKNLASKQTVDTQQALVAQMEAQIKADQATIDNAKTQLEYTVLTSPIDGRTGIRMVDVGNNLHSGNNTCIVVVTQVQPISIVFSLPEDALPRITQAAAQGPIGVTALSRDDKTTLDEGALVLVDNQIDQTTGMVKLKATFPNANNTMWPGQFVNARLLLQTRQQALTIPSVSAQRGAKGMFAYVVKQDSTVEARPIKTGSETGDAMLVEDGLSEGERVVTSNQFRLQPGTLVKSDSEGEKTPPPLAEGSSR
jgi:multidrug efflux system membrane fusion protein